MLKSFVISSSLLLSCGVAWSQVTQRVSVTSGGAESAEHTVVHSMTPDGRYVALGGDLLVPGDGNAALDVFVRDRRTGLTELVSVDSSGAQGNSQSDGGWLSADARFVAFRSFASNLVPNDTNGWWDAFVRDRAASVTERVSVSSSGAQANGGSFAGPITPDGRYVVITSYATNLVPGSVGGGHRPYLRDRWNGTTERLCLSVVGGPSSMECYAGSISADGRFVAFWSGGSDLVLGDQNPYSDVFVFDRQTGTNELVSVDSAGTQANSWSEGATAISADGRFVAFASNASNLVPGDTNGWADVFVRDRHLGTTERVSVGSDGTQSDDESSSVSISADGRYVAFVSDATTLVAGDTNGRRDVFVHDRRAGTTERISVSSAGEQGDDQVPSYVGVAISADGRFVAFASFATNLIPSDANGVLDAFVRERSGGTRFTSACDPAVGGVIACPCSNAPSSLGRGCDNSSQTGGAILSASGGAYLSSDSLVFETSGERPGALSIVTQATGASPTGTVFGQGVLCAAGAFTRLYVATASNGTIRVPDFNAGDAPVSVRSASRGDAIAAGQSRWYVVTYRDPIVLGGCPASSSFNATQTGHVAWWP